MLNAYFMPGAIPGARNIMTNKENTVFFLVGVTVSPGGPQSSVHIKSTQGAYLKQDSGMDSGLLE